MKKNLYSTEQTASALKLVELGVSVADLIRQLGIVKGNDIANV